MGYETMLVVGTVHHFKKSTRAQYFSVVATIDLCKLGDSEIFNLDWKSPKPVVYFYAPGHGSKRIMRDYYDQALKPVPAALVIEALRKDNQSSRRTRWAVAMLMEMVEDAPDLDVLFFGH